MRLKVIETRIYSMCALYFKGDGEMKLNLSLILPFPKHEYMTDKKATSLFCYKKKQSYILMIEIAHLTASDRSMRPALNINKTTGNM